MVRSGEAFWRTLALLLGGPVWRLLALLTGFFLGACTEWLLDALSDDQDHGATLSEREVCLGPWLTLGCLTCWLPLFGCLAWP